MFCARLNHFVRFNPDGSVSRCGHMINAPKFDNLNLLESSEWLKNIKYKFDSNIWPNECTRCRQVESINQTSIRINANQSHSKQTKQDYLIVGGVLDNICNSACQFCSANLSTKIGSLSDSNYIIIDNSNKFWQLPVDRIVHLDINGGEPSVSKNYKQIINNLPTNVKSIRLNTNCSSVLYELLDITKKGVEVTVTVSFDGIGKVHDYIRWPITYDKFLKNLMIYKSMPISLNLWTTVNALNIGIFNDIIKFASENKIDHSWAILDQPEPLSIKYKNFFTLSAKVPDFLLPVVAQERNNEYELFDFLNKQDSIRKINYKNFYEV